MDYSLGCFFGQLIGDALGSRYEFKKSNQVYEMVNKTTSNAVDKLINSMNDDTENDVQIMKKEQIKIMLYNNTDKDDE